MCVYKSMYNITKFPVTTCLTVVLWFLRLIVLKRKAHDMMVFFHPPNSGRSVGCRNYHRQKSI